MKKNSLFICTISLMILSFYLMDQIVRYRKEKDPIMQEIRKSDLKYRIDPINAQIKGNTIISGKNGKEIDYAKTYQKMKSYGTYNELYTTIKETTPTISIENNYDKYIIKGNKKDRKIALVFPITEKERIDSLLTILKNKKVSATFFIDGSMIENQITLLKESKYQEFNLLSYHSTYEESFFKTSLSYLESLTGKKSKYCYTEKENKSLLALCTKLKLHTIKPTLRITKNLYSTVKENLENAMIVSLENNTYIKKELPTTIDYIRQKGYQLVSLDNLLKENY